MEKLPPKKEVVHSEIHMDEFFALDDVEEEEIKEDDTKQQETCFDEYYLKNADFLPEWLDN